MNSFNKNTRYDMRVYTYVYPSPNIPDIVLVAPDLQVDNQFATA